MQPGSSAGQSPAGKGRTRKGKNPKLSFSTSIFFNPRSRRYSVFKTLQGLLFNSCGEKKIRNRRNIYWRRPTFGSSESTSATKPRRHSVLLAISSEQGYSRFWAERLTSEGVESPQNKPMQRRWDGRFELSTFVTIVSA